MKKLILALLLSWSLPISAEAATYWASVSGGAGTCAAASGTTDPGSYRTLAQGIACLKAGAGDTLILKAGTYNNNGLIVPSGTIAAHTTIRSDTTGTVRFTNSGFDLYNGNVSYVDFIGNRSTLNMEWDGTSHTGENANAFSICSASALPPQKDGSSGCTGENNHITFDGVRMHHWDGTAITTYSAGNIFRYSRFDNNGNFLDAGNNVGYAFYISSGSNGNIFEYNEVDNSGGYGFHIYSGYDQTADNNIIRFNRIHDNGKVASGNDADGILLGGGSVTQGTPSTNNQAYGNIIWSERDAGIRVAYSCDKCLVYNNTIYGSNPGRGIQIDAAATETIVRNNIISNNTGGNITNAGSNSIFSNNLCSSSCGFGTSNQTEVAASTFNNAAALDFTLKTGSLAINNGIINIAPGINIPACSGGITAGCYNGAAPDIGGLETGSPTAGGGPPTLTPNLTSVAAGAQILLTVDDDDVNERIENPGDWVGIWSSPAGVFIDYFFMNNTKTAPATAISDAVIAFTAPSTPGTYEFRFYQNGSSLEADRLATTPFTVTAPGIVMKFNVSALKVGPSVTWKVGTP